MSPESLEVPGRIPMVSPGSGFTVNPCNVCYEVSTSEIPVCRLAGLFESTGRLRPEKALERGAASDESGSG